MHRIVFFGGCVRGYVRKSNGEWVWIRPHGPTRSIAARARKLGPLKSMIAEHYGADVGDVVFNIAAPVQVAALR